jgi:23S rRNA (cytidine1920-2'-O)/16S rRNA (cytidine1409-2'-O)-methyltransferase
MERTNAMHVALPEAMDLVTIDVGWTRQHHVLTNAVRMLKPGGRIVTLIKPHYEADRKKTKGGVLDNHAAREVLEEVVDRIQGMNLCFEQTLVSPIAGQKGNIEFLALLRPTAVTPDRNVSG